jgi:integrase
MMLKTDKRKYKRNGKLVESEYYYVWGSINGQRIDRCLKTRIKKVADELARQIETEVARRRHGISVNQDIRLTTFMEKYLEYCRANNKPSTAAKKVFDVQFILAYFGDIPLANLTPEAIEAFKAERRSKVAAATVNNDLATLKHALNLAVEWDYLDRSPAAKVRKYVVKNARTRHLSFEEEAALLGECSVELKPIVITALNTGMRLGEILVLDWKDIDLKRKQITIVDSKNSESRVVPINSVLYNLLIAMEPKQGFVFHTRLGGPYKSVQTGFKAAVTRAGIKDFTFHDLRHTFASKLAMANVSLSTIGALLGHRTLLMTRRYAHLSPDYLTSVVELLTQNQHTEANGKTEAVK